jgi:GntR family histidine utilization transcriptional repressor
LEHAPFLALSADIILLKATLKSKGQNRMPLQTATDKTSFREVKAEILRRITDGPWGPGTLLPGEVALAGEFGCSRTTINRAMQEVSGLGLVDRRRKSGTRVRMAPLRQARFEMPIIRAEIEKSGAAYRYSLISRQISDAPDWLRARLNLAAGGKAVHLLCLHSANGAPVQLEDRWISAAALPKALDQDFSATGPNEWLVATVPFSEVEISFLAAAADSAAVRHLGHSPGDPVFCIERTTWWKGAGITHVTLSHCHSHRLTTRY